MNLKRLRQWLKQSNNKYWQTLKYPHLGDILVEPAYKPGFVMGNHLSSHIVAHMIER